MLEDVLLEALRPIIKKLVKEEVETQYKQNESQGVKPYMTRSEFAEAFGVTPQTVTNMKTEGRLPVVQITPTKYVVDVQEYIVKNKSRKLSVMR